MTYRQRLLSGALLAIALINLPGCSMFKSAMHELQPHRLHRWNRTDALGGGTDDYYMSVSDSVPSTADAKTSPPQSLDAN